MTERPPWKVVWITGASTGIGREIALQLASQGVKVAASARDAKKLAELGSGIRPYPLDVTDAEAVKATIQSIEREMGPIDIAILGAGSYSPVEAHKIDAALFSSIITVNYLGVVNGLAGLLPAMLERRAGHISWIASVVGYRGLPKAAAYGPSKAALINLAECIKPELELKGITISVINPGFVETPMTAANDFPMPFLMKPEEAARLTIAGLAKKRFEVAYPGRFVAILKIGRVLPYWLYFKIIRRTILK